MAAFTKDQLRSVGIFNHYEYAQKNPYIYYRPNSSNPREMIYSAWVLHWPGVKFNGHWHDYGDYVVDVGSRTHKEEKLQEIIAKFKELFQCEELAKTPFGGYMEKKFVERRNKEIREMLKNRSKNED